MIAGLTNQMKSCNIKTPIILKVPLTTATAVQASAASLQFTKATFYGYKAVSSTATPTNNAATAYIGTLDVANGSGAGVNSTPFVTPITAGAAVVVGGIAGNKYDLSQFWLLGTSTDFVFIVLEQ